MAKKITDEETFSYDKSMEEIEEILEMAENNELGIDELTEKVQRVSTLLAKCQKKLKKTYEKIKKIFKEIE